jgi:hypothetical protein
MSRKRNPQLAPAAALVQLLQEHPDLPALTWTIQRGGPAELRGDAYAEDHPFEVLRSWADVLGGEITPDTADFECGGLRRRMHRLTTVWRDVRVVVSAAATVGVYGPVFVAGLVAEQRHQLVDPAVPVFPGACRVAGLGRAA